MFLCRTLYKRKLNAIRRNGTRQLNWIPIRKKSVADFRLEGSHFQLWKWKSFLLSIKLICVRLSTPNISSNCESLFWSKLKSKSILKNVDYVLMFLMFIGPCIVVIVEEWKTNLMSLLILFHFLCAQHVSDINPLNTELNPICQ